MKIKLMILLMALAIMPVSLTAQNLTGKVTDASGEPLIGASVYWAGTTVGGSTDTEGNYIIYRVKGHDRLVAAYLGFTNDTLQVADGVERLDFQLEADGVAVEIKLIIVICDINVKVCTVKLFIYLLIKQCLYFIVHNNSPFYLHLFSVYDIKSFQI